MKKEKASSFQVKTPKESLGFLLWQVTVTWQRKIKEVLKGEGVTHTQFVVLANLLWFEENQIESTQGQVVAQSKIDKMTVSLSLKQLVGLDLVSRFENEEDSRFKTVKLTKTGRTLTQKLVALVETCDEDYFKTLSKDEKKKFSTLLLSLVS